MTATSLLRREEERLSTETDEGMDFKQINQPRVKCPQNCRRKWWIHLPFSDPGGKVWNPRHFSSRNQKRIDNIIITSLAINQPYTNRTFGYLQHKAFSKALSWWYVKVLHQWCFTERLSSGILQPVPTYSVYCTFKWTLHSNYCVNNQTEVTLCIKCLHGLK